MRAICSVVAVGVLLGGCDKLFGLARVNADIAIDAPSDGAQIDAPCLGRGILTGLCLEAPTPMLDLTSAIDTSSDPKCRVVAQDMGPELCVIDANDIAISEGVIVTGARPLVLLAANRVEISNALDASSRRMLRVGAAAQTTCRGGTGMNGAQGAGGGAGGTFGFPGGPGGAGQSGSAVPAAGGPPTSVAPQTAVYGGCGAGSGGLSLNSGTTVEAAGGAGGGAVYVIAGAQIHVALNGSINASGAAGDGAAKYAGGGGGGSGGFIALDAPMIVVDGVLYARGGAGGGGGGITTAGQAGTEASGPTGAISGGIAGTSGGTGGGDGCGAPVGQQGGITSSATAGGGGGGGGCGRIRLYGTKSGVGLINPAPT